MPLGIEIKLPKSHQPIFPDRCVACGSDRPGSTIPVGTTDIWNWAVGQFKPGRRVTVEVPACPFCALDLYRQRRFRMLAGLAFGLAALAVMFAFLLWFRGPRLVKKWSAISMAVLSILPYVLWEMLSPRPIDLVASHETLDYTFRDARFAIEFAALNGVPVGVGDASPPV